MRRKPFVPMAAAGLLAAALFAAPARGEAQVTQSLTLNPGWNAIFLEVEPATNDFAELFAGLPVESVWGWLDKTFSMQFVQNPNALLPDAPGWRARFLKPGEEYLSTLHALQGNRAYLVKLGGSVARSWSVSGKPSLQPIPWVPNSFNLTGFHLDPAIPAAQMPTVAEFLAPSEAHAGKAFYRLVGDAWTYVDDPAAARLKAGEAYWIWCEGGSDYQGPLALDLPARTGLDFSGGLSELKLTVVNREATSRSVTILQEPLPIPEVLVVRSWNGTTGKVEWPPLSALGPLTVDGSGGVSLGVAVRRADFTTDLVEQVLTVRDDRGTRIFVPVTARR